MAMPARHLAFFCIGTITIANLPISVGDEPQAKDSSGVLTGTNSNGDTVRWTDGSTWKSVTVKSFKLVEKDKTQVPTLELTDLPSGKKAGEFADFASVSLRSADPAPFAVAELISATKVYTAGYEPKRVEGLPPLKIKYDDTYGCPWQTAWDKGLVKPEFSMKAVKNGKPIFLQLRTTITHVEVKDGNAYFLVRRHEPTMVAPDGWYSDIDFAIFSRQVVKAEGEEKATAKLDLAKKLLKSNPSAAKQRLQEIVKQFPKTAAAQEAEKLLNEIK